MLSNMFSHVVSTADLDGVSLNFQISTVQDMLFVSSTNLTDLKAVVPLTWITSNDKKLM